jgi:hypothetical protein
VTLGEMIDVARRTPSDVREGRRRRIVALQARISRNQRDRELAELGLIDLGGEG